MIATEVQSPPGLDHLDAFRVRMQCDKAGYEPRGLFKRLPEGWEHGIEQMVRVAHCSSCSDVSFVAHLDYGRRQYCCVWGGKYRGLAEVIQIHLAADDEQL
jgi:hypothetical protein